MGLPAEIRIETAETEEKLKRVLQELAKQGYASLQKDCEKYQKSSSSLNKTIMFCLLLFMKIFCS